MGRSRIASIDVVRGLIMVIMALDHSHDFFGNFAANPTDLATTTVGLFFTRWITHICAPTFFLLTGTGAYLTLGRMSQGALARYLVSRGLWLGSGAAIRVRGMGAGARPALPAVPLVCRGPPASALVVAELGPGRFCNRRASSVDLPALVWALDPGSCPAPRCFGQKACFLPKAPPPAAAGHIPVPVQL